MVGTQPFVAQPSPIVFLVGSPLPPTLYPNPSCPFSHCFRLFVFQHRRNRVLRYVTENVTQITRALAGLLFWRQIWSWGSTKTLLCSHVFMGCRRWWLEYITELSSREANYITRNKIMCSLVLPIFRGKHAIFQQPDIIFSGATYTGFHGHGSFYHPSMQTKFEGCEVQRSYHSRNPARSRSTRSLYHDLFMTCSPFGQN